MKKSSATELKIIDAAASVFMEKGKDGARMQEIADLAGINKALLHYYFRSKEKLFAEVFRLEIPKIVANIFEIDDESHDFRLFLKGFIDKYIENILPRRNLIRFALWIGEKARVEIGQIFLDTFKEHGFKTNPLVDKIERAISDGQIRRVEPSNFAISLIGMCIFPVVGAPIVEKVFPVVRTEGKKFLEMRKEEIFNLVWNGVRAD